jgi:phenylpropionate dioxygenase-like ring-hydroxylating dioxygenase large terminal subunit
MLSKADNELVTNISPGQPMGEFFRRFWMPVALAEELPGPDGVPLRVEILDEKLVAFRDSDGRVGLMDAYCPHRGAPLFFGRNEENGLRCIYHGWKFDVDGNCVDIPNAPEGEVFKNKIQAKNYPCVEAGNMIFAYMGPKDKQPPFPEFEWTKLPAEHRFVMKFQVECNYLQAMEGDYDPGHGPFLHTKIDGSPQVQQFNNVQVRPRNRPTPENEPFPRAVGPRRQTEADKQAWGTIEDTDTGVFFLSSGERPDGTKIASLSPWMMPIYCTAGTTAGTNTMSTNIRVPINNEKIWFYRLRWSYDPIPQPEIDEYKNGGWYYPELIPGTYIGVQNVHNDYKIDRQVQRNFTYSGIPCFPWQDVSMMENQWGPLADRTQEHLTSSDFKIIYIRRRLLKTVKALAAGIEPSEPWSPEGYRYHIARVTTQEGTLDEAIEKVKAMAGEAPASAEALKVAVEVRT